MVVNAILTGMVNGQDVSKQTAIEPIRFKLQEKIKDVC